MDVDAIRIEKLTQKNNGDALTTTSVSNAKNPGISPLNAKTPS